MSRNWNGLLLIVVLAVGALNYITFNNNISLKNFVQKIQADDYKSPLGTRPSKAFEQNWENERAR